MALGTRVPRLLTEEGEEAPRSVLVHGTASTTDPFQEMVNQKRETTQEIFTKERETTQKIFTKERETTQEIFTKERETTLGLVMMTTRDPEITPSTS